MADFLIVFIWIVIARDFFFDDTIPYMYGGDGKRRLRDLKPPPPDDDTPFAWTPEARGKI